MRITITSVFVNDQESALAFYTDVLGFQVRHNVPMGEHAWITVVSPAATEGPELLLEPAGHPAVKPYRDALVEDGIPLAQFGVDDVHAEYERLAAQGVTFTQPPTEFEGHAFAQPAFNAENLLRRLGPFVRTPTKARPSSQLGAPSLAWPGSPPEGSSTAGSELFGLGHPSLRLP